jgi:hypothetical protein
MLVLAGCAHPQAIQKVSQEETALLVQFRAALDEVRSHVRTALNESIQDYREARVHKWLVTEAGSLSSRINACTQPGAPQTCGTLPLRARLDAAAAYLARGQVSLFADFCGASGTWETMKPPWMRRPNDTCPSRPKETVLQLERIRDRLDESLKQMGENIASLQKSHAVIDKFLQIRIELTKENVDAAQSAITKATAAEEEVRKVLAQLSADRRP